MNAASSSDRILVVDDDPDVREALQLLLERRGYEVCTAGNGVEALEELEHDRPRLILLDLMMPVMSGPQFLKILRADPRFSDLPVLLVTAWPAEAATMAGAQGVVSKPVNIHELSAMIEHAR